MATKKKMLQAAAGNATGGAVLNVEDVFSTYLYTGTSTNQTLTNGLKNDFTNEDVTTVYDIPPTTSTDSVSLEYFDDSSLTDTGTPPISTDSHKTNGRSVNLVDGGGYRNSSASNDFAYGTGDYCIELWVKRTTATSGRVVTHSDNSLNIDINSSGGISTYQAGGANAPNGSVPVGQWVHFAITRSSGTVRLFINGTLQSSGSSSENYSTSRQIHIGADNNFTGGNFPGLIGDVRVFKGSANYTSNFTPATTLTDTTNVFLLISYNSSTTFTTESVTRTVQTVHSHVFGWAKNRGNSNYHALSNTLVGGEYALISNSTSEERYRPDTKYISSLTSDGVVLGTEGDINSNGGDFVSWWWRQAPKFFDVVTWTGDGTSNRAIPHDLGGAVGSYFVKCTSASTASDWIVWHKDSGANNFNLVLNTTAAVTNFNFFSTTAPDSSNVYLGTSNLDYVNATGRTYVAYIFAHNDGDGGFGPDGDADIIKCGSFTGTGASSTEVDLGFEPQWLLIKASSLSQDWRIMDNMRGITDGEWVRLAPNNSSAEASFSGDYLKVTPTGFVASQFNTGQTFIYIAIRRGTKVPESATEVFQAASRDTTGGVEYYSGWPVDLIISALGTNTTHSNFARDRLRGGNYLLTESTAAEATGTYYFDSNAGFRTGSFTPNAQFFSWMWKRAPGFFDAVAFTSAASGNTSFNHNLGDTPAFVIIKNRQTADPWIVYHVGVGNDEYLQLNSTAAPDPLVNSFSVGGTSVTVSSSLMYTSQPYIAYLFASLPGISKVGSYTGNGGSGDINVDCGFSSGARFVLIKDTTSANDWYVWDSERGIVSGNDPYLRLNLNSAESTTSDWIDPYSAGFTVTTGLYANLRINVSGNNYIFYAIA